MHTSTLQTAIVADLTSFQLKIIDVVAYFDIFNFPVTEKEICNLIGLSSLEFLEEITPLLLAHKIFSAYDHFSGSHEISELVHLRRQREAIAKPYYQQLKKHGRIISRFPFVRGIAVSGSLSKGVMQKDGDIDYFIITAPGRLWLCRSLLVLYKKIVLFNSHKYFCLNYFVDQNSLQIMDKNVFTAIEIFYLLPVYSSENTLNTFFKNNVWVSSYFRENSDRTTEHYVTNNSIPKKFIEKILEGNPGNFIEKIFHKFTLSKWMKKFGHFSKEKFELTMRSTAGVSKHHPRDFQSKVLKQHTEKVASILSR